MRHNGPYLAVPSPIRNVTPVESQHAGCNLDRLLQRGRLDNCEAVYRQARFILEHAARGQLDPHTVGL